jgi:hypothetical protein
MQTGRLVRWGMEVENLYFLPAVKRPRGLGSRPDLSTLECAPETDLFRVAALPHLFGSFDFLEDFLIVFVEESSGGAELLCYVN